MKDNILLTRIDNRLVHGQVGVTWTNGIGARQIVVVDDELENDFLSKKLMKSVASSAGVKIFFYTIDGFVKAYQTNEIKPLTFLVVKTPAVAQQIVVKGVKLKDINIGNMHFSSGKIKINEKMYVDEQDVTNINYLVEQDCNVFFQDVPGTTIKNINKLEFER